MTCLLIGFLDLEQYSDFLDHDFGGLHVVPVSLIVILGILALRSRLSTRNLHP